MRTSKLYVLSGMALVAAGCAGHDDPSGTAATASGSPAVANQVATSGTHPSPAQPPTNARDVFVAEEGPEQSCTGAAPLACPGGYRVREVDRAGARPFLVSKLDARAIGKDALEQAENAGRGKLVLHGRLGSVDPITGVGELVVLEVWRGMPGVEAREDDAYVAVHATGDGLVAERLNAVGRRSFAELSIDGAAAPWVDRGWLESRVVDHGALVAGRFEGESLVAAQVFVRLPDVVGPCPDHRIWCATGEATYARNADRCLVPTGCTEGRACPLLAPRCEPGYRIASWPTQPDGCLAFACDPAFLRD